MTDKSESRRVAGMDAIAKKLGVSKTTVHYALRNKGRISEATRERVIQASREMGYRPNLLARSLRTKKTDTIGVVVVSLNTTYHAHVLEGIDGAAQNADQTILLACSYGDPEREHALVEVLLEKGVDGLLVAPCDAPQSVEYYEKLRRDGTSLVFFDRGLSGVEVDSVATDNEEGAHRLVEHLIQTGRRRVAFLTTMPAEQGSSSVRARLDGCNRALREASLEEAVVLGVGAAPSETDQSFAFGVVRDYLGSGSPAFDALFAAHDGLAIGAAEALFDKGLRVPDDVALVGFDDQDASAYFQPPLTTVRQPAKDVGRRAIETLFRRQAGELEVPEIIALEPELIVRKSSGGSHSG